MFRHAKAHARTTAGRWRVRCVIPTVQYGSDTLHYPPSITLHYPPSITLHYPTAINPSCAATPHATHIKHFLQMGRGFQLDRFPAVPPVTHARYNSARTHRRARHARTLATRRGHETAARSAGAASSA
jgi:hypothetical protein